MVGSMERYFTRASAWPSVREGSGTSASWKSSGASKPLGRDCSFNCRFVSATLALRFARTAKIHRMQNAHAMAQSRLCHQELLERDILVGDFGSGAGSCGFVVAGAACGVEVFAAARGASAHGSCARAGCGAIGASAQHAEIIGDDVVAGALLAFLVLPLAGLDAPLNEN